MLEHAQVNICMSNILWGGTNGLVSSRWVIIYKVNKDRKFMFLTLAHAWQPLLRLWYLLYTMVKI